MTDTQGHQAQPAQEAGTIVRGPDGALYFIRDELLQQCKMPEDLVKQAEDLLSRQQVEGYNIQSEPTLQPLAHVNGPTNKDVEGYYYSISSYSTVMCPSFIFEYGSFYTEVEQIQPETFG